MPTYSLDTFIAAVQDSMASAQEQVRRRSQSKIERLLDLDDEGQPRSVTWSMRIPARRKGQPSTRELPLLTLMTNKVTQVTELNVDLDCRVEEVPAQKAAPHAKRLALVPQPRKEPRPSGVHRVRLALRGGENPSGEVLIDGVRFKEIPPRVKSRT